MTTFHYAFKVTSLENTASFYGDILGCSMGRSTDKWVDFNFFGHQLSAHLTATEIVPDYSAQVDNVRVPMPHFGCILSLPDFKKIQKRLETNRVTFILKPQLRYANQPGEQWTMFFLDPSGNALEFKAFTNPEEIFVTK